jgi:hypothetical protein
MIEICLYHNDYNESPQLFPRPTAWTMRSSHEASICYINRHQRQRRFHLRSDIGDEEVQAHRRSDSEHLSYHCYMVVVKEAADDRER